MRIPVKCKNCGLLWERVTMFGKEIELTEDLQYHCPKCASNWYEVATKKIKSVDWYKEHAREIQLGIE